MPTIAEALQLAAGHHQSGRLFEAEQIYRQILTVAPNHADAWHLLAVIHYQYQHFQESLKFIDRAIELKVKAIDELSIRLKDVASQHQANESVTLIQEQINKQQYSIADSHNNRGLVLNDIEHFEDAVESYHRALALCPAHADALNNLGNAFYSLCRFDEAIFYGRQALQLKPSDPIFCNNLATSLKEAGEFEEAIGLFEKSLQTKPDYEYARYNLSVVKLLMGNWGDGWREYEARWHVKNAASRFPQLKQPVWNGESLTGKTILLCAEQGLGDTIQFIRYAQLINNLGGKVLLICPNSLIPLLSRLSTIDLILEKNKPYRKFDYYIPLLSLPRIFNTTPATIPALTPYMHADTNLVDYWRTRLQGKDGIKIGINWRGREKQGPWLKRNLPLEMFSIISAIPGVRLYSLQKGSITPQEQSLLDQASIITFGDNFDNSNGPFMDTAAIMKNLDLVITSDTSIAHLAGALGVPVWIALPSVPDWRWLLNREDSPWYPTMRLFRQTKQGEWGDVFERMVDFLGSFSKSGMKF